eukprot:Selendium_serpulae@DN5968_c0_g1_i10.p1
MMEIDVPREDPKRIVNLSEFGSRAANSAHVCRKSVTPFKTRRVSVICPTDPPLNPVADSKLSTPTKGGSLGGYNQTAACFSALLPTKTASDSGLAQGAQKGAEYGFVPQIPRATDFGLVPHDKKGAAFGTAPKAQDTGVALAPKAQKTSGFGLAPEAQKASGFGLAPKAQKASGFGLAPEAQKTSGFGLAPEAQKASGFGLAPEAQKAPTPRLAPEIQTGADSGQTPHQLYHTNDGDKSKKADQRLSHHLTSTVGGKQLSQLSSHPFAVELGDGFLPMQKFKHYIEQDNFILEHYAKMSARTIDQSSGINPQMVTYANFLAGLLNDSFYDRAASPLGIAKQNISHDKLLGPAMMKLRNLCQSARDYPSYVGVMFGVQCATHSWIEE